MEWTRGPVIGRGSTATVSVATFLSSGQLFAVKSAELALSTFLQKEQHFLSKLNSPYIVKCFGFDVTYEAKPVYNVLLELASHGTIHDEIQRHGGKLNEATIRVCTRSILRGLDYLHDRGIVHCDIKSQNVLVNRNGDVKIADFGCAKVGRVKKGDRNSAFSGTPAFMAPEVARGEEQEFAADVWAVGCTIIEMASGNQPWKAEFNDPVSALYRIGFSDDVPEVPGWLSETAKDFLKRSLVRDPRERWTVKELLSHPFLDEFDHHYSKEVHGFSLNSSPSCVLDNKFWDSINGVESPLNSTHECYCFLNPPLDRIKNLTGSVADLPNWCFEEDWTTVRSRDVEETKNGSEQNVDSGNEDLVGPEIFGVDTDSVADQQDLEGSNFEEDLILSFFVENVSTFSSSSTTRGINFVPIFLPHEKQNNNSFAQFKSKFHSSTLFIVLFFSFFFFSFSNTYL